jgi:hypothetical protein
MGITDFEKLNKWEDRHCLKYNIVLKVFYLWKVSFVLNVKLLLYDSWIRGLNFEPGQCIHIAVDMIYLYESFSKNNVMKIHIEIIYNVPLLKNCITFLLSFTINNILLK